MLFEVKFIQLDQIHFAVKSAQYDGRITNQSIRGTTARMLGPSTERI